LTTAASSAATIATSAIARPAISRAADRPVITHGVQSGDVSAGSGVVWARTDRPARMLVEVSTSDSFRAIRSAVHVDALPETDFTAKVLLEDLPAGQHIFYRISFQDHASPTIIGESQSGNFRRRRATAARCCSCGRATSLARAGELTNRAAGCAALRRCTHVIRISLSIPATASTPIAR
jgi:phosphodiesterase/alkaline phosphatase D-like protein